MLSLPDCRGDLGALAAIAIGYAPMCILAAAQCPTECSELETYGNKVIAI
jgi:hypothetical protein